MREEGVGDEPVTADGRDDRDEPVAADGRDDGNERVATDHADGPARDEPRVPLGDLAEGTDRREAPAADDPAVEALFERESVDGIDPDALWKQIRSDEPPEFEREEREIREISTASFCHRCPHFSAPPAVRCEHEGTDILEVPSRETFRVADCPRVLEEESLDARR